MDTAVQSILDELAQLGVEATPNGSKIRVSKPKLVDAALRKRIDANKPALLVALLAKNSTTPIPVTDRLDNPPPPPLPDDYRSLNAASLASTADGDRPHHGCWNCRGREFHKLNGAPLWICTSCHPSSEVSERFTAPLESLRPDAAPESDEPIQISRVTFVPDVGGTKPDGTMGIVTLRLAGCVQVEGISVKRLMNNSIALTFPEYRAARGKLRAMVEPLDEFTRREIEQRVFAAIRAKGFDL